MATYRIRIDLTYTTNGNANTATSNINNVMIAAGLPERAERTGTAVSMIVEGLTEASANQLRVDLTAAWGSTTRSGGKVSVVRRPDE